MPHPDIAVVLGTRPEIIKMAPVMRELGDRAYLIHSGQHYDEQLSGQHFAALGLKAPHLVVDGVGGRDRGVQIATIIAELTKEFQRRRPRVVLVQGDTNTVSAAAQAAHYQGIPVVHVEAGLRSYDRDMPEEINRLVTGSLADVHCAPTWPSAHNLMREGIKPTHIAVTGNTVVEATEQALAAPGSDAVRWFGSAIPNQYAVATIHRPENTDDAAALERVLRGLDGISIPVLFFMHPRTKLAVERFGLDELLQPLLVHEAPNSSDFLHAAAGATVLVSDSGGVQEECTVLKVPLAIVRKSTERPESIDAGFAWLIRPTMDLASEVNAIIDNKRLPLILSASSSPFGDGKASARIARISEAIADGVTPSDAVQGLSATPAGVL